jgi:hypothetical protein
VISILVALIILGVILYVVNTVVPMEPWVKTVLNAVIILLVLVWLVQTFFPASLRLPVPR